MNGAVPAAVREVLSAPNSTSIMARPSVRQSAADPASTADENINRLSSFESRAAVFAPGTDLGLGSCLCWEEAALLTAQYPGGRR